MATPCKYFLKGISEPFESKDKLLEYLNGPIHQANLKGKIHVLSGEELLKRGTNDLPSYRQNPVTGLTDPCKMKLTLQGDFKHMADKSVRT